MTNSRGLGRIYVRRHGKRPLPGEPDLRTPHWWVTHSVDGVRHREPAKPNTERAAVALLKRRLAEQASGTFTGRAAERISFDDLVELLESDYRANARQTLDRALRSVKNLRLALGGLNAVQINRAAVARYVSARRARGAAANTVQNEVNALSKMLGLAVRHGLLASAPKFDRLKAAPPRDEYFTEDEMRRVLDVLEHGQPATAFQPALKPQPGLAAAVAFAAWSGWRLRSDVLPLRWSNVNWEAGIVVRPNRGTSKAHTALNWPLDAVPEVSALFERQREHTVALDRERGVAPVRVFTRENGAPIVNYAQAFEKACRACGLARVPHDLRRTAARRLRARGLSDRDIAEVVGWRTVAMVSRYLGADPAGVSARLKAAVAQGTDTIRTRSGIVPERSRRGA